MTYRVRVEGHLDSAWARVLGAAELEHAPDGATVLTFDLPDQAALYGVLNRIRDVGAPLLTVTRDGAGAGQGDGPGGDRR